MILPWLQVILQSASPRRDRFPIVQIQELHLDTHCFPREVEFGCQGTDCVECVQQFLLELFRGNAIWIVRRRSKGYREITKDYVEERLYVTCQPPVQTRAGQELTSTWDKMSNSINSTLPMEKASSKFRGSFSPSAMLRYPTKNSFPIDFNPA